MSPEAARARAWARLHSVSEAPVAGQDVGEAGAPPAAKAYKVVAARAGASVTRLSTMNGSKASPAPAAALLAHLGAPHSGGRK